MSSSVLDPELVRRIQALELRAREVADGVLMGIHHAPHKGRSLEFAEHKEYSPGDDIRRIDWKVYGKSDRLYIKEFEDETNINAVLLVDGSRSMDYPDDGNGRMKKLDSARIMAAAIGYLLLTQSDAAGLGVVRDGLYDWLPPRARQAHFHELTRRLAMIEPLPGTDIPRALADLAALLKGRAMVIVFSDLLDDPHQLMRSVRLLGSKRHETVLFHVLDPDEIEFPFSALSMFKDMEEPLQLMIDPRTIRREYRKNFGRFMEDIKAECAGRGIDYHLARTDQPPAKTITSWLSIRAAAGPRKRRRR